MFKVEMPAKKQMRKSIRVNVHTQFLFIFMHNYVSSNNSLSLFNCLQCCDSPITSLLKFSKQICDHPIKFSLHITYTKLRQPNKGSWTNDMKRSHHFT